MSTASFSSVLSWVRSSASTLRTSGTQQAGTQITDVAEFDLALAHLRVPEMV
jgi:hypothetical protein